LNIPMKRRLEAGARYASSALAFGMASSLFTAMVLINLVQPLAAHADEFSDAATSSAKTVSAASYDPNYTASPMPDLKVTVNQTADLTSQAIYVSWTGGKYSSRPRSDRGGSDFLQVMQCWGDDAVNPDRPDPTTCQYGRAGLPGATRGFDVNYGTLAAADRQYATSPSETSNAVYWAMPFNAYGGEQATALIKDPKTGIVSRDSLMQIDDNQFFTRYTTNFVPWAGAAKDGTGGIKFESQTTMQSPGLGCGAPITTSSGLTGKSCWLVVIPRGEIENGESYINTPGLMSQSWSHHIAIRLNYRPVGISCNIGTPETQITGGELGTEAVASWQPKLCSNQGGSAFVLATANEQDSLAAAENQQDAPLVLTSYPSQQPDSGLIYAPVAVGADAISFAIDRLAPYDSGATLELRSKNYTPFQSLNLTPRLIAKLLTNSYVLSLPPADRSHIGYKNAAEVGPNAPCLTKDKDFLAVNDSEWRYQDVCAIPISDLMTPLGRSDMAQRLWEYVLTDKDACDFLNGTPDPWGMRVNPWYSTNLITNLSGTATNYPRRDFPKADPIEIPSTLPNNPVFGQGAINLVTWRPYTNDFQTSAALTLRGDGQLIGQWDNTISPGKFLKQTPLASGLQRVMAVTSASGALKYGNITASLLNPAGEFVRPNIDSLSAAQAAFTTDSKTKISSFVFDSDLARESPNAYPLTIPVYAAVNQGKTSTAMAEKYSAFITYAATLGQVPGDQRGQLPRGYAPMADFLKMQALQDASLIRNGMSQPAVPTTNPTPDVQQPSPGVVLPSNSPASVVFGPKTPKDPWSGPLSGSVPTSFAAGALAGLFWTRRVKFGRKTRPKEPSLAQAKRSQ
jgi:hypothetical protein